MASTPIACPRETTDKRRTTTTNGSSSHHHDSAPSRLHSLIYTGAEPIHQVRCPRKLPAWPWPPETRSFFCHFGGFFLHDGQDLLRRLCIISFSLSVRDTLHRSRLWLLASMLRMFQVSLVQPLPSHKNPLTKLRRASSVVPWIVLLGRKVLAVPATSAAPQRIFSAAGNIMTKKRARSTCDHLEELMYLH